MQMIAIIICADLVFAGIGSQCGEKMRVAMRGVWAVAMVTAAGMVFAQDDNKLDEVVISASGFEQKISDAPASVTVVGREKLESKPYAGLADALRDVEGVDVGASTDKNGNISISLRGLPPEYTLILINGRRQNDVGNIGPNNFNSSQFMYMPPLSSIERIEVVRGPMSTLYGSDAIGGVINIITRKVSKEWGGSLSNSMTLQENAQYGDDRKTDLYVSGPLVEDRVGLVLRGSIFNREETAPTYSTKLALPAVDINGDPNPAFWEDSGSFGDKKAVAAQTWNIGSTLTLTPTADHDFSLDVDIAKQRYDNAEGQTGTLDGTGSLWLAANSGIVQPRVGYREEQRVEREQFSISHTGRWSFGTTETSLSHLAGSNLGRSLPLTLAERTALQGIWDQAAIDQGVTGMGNDKPVLTGAIEDQLEAQFLPRPLRTLESRSTTFDSRLDTYVDNHFIAVGVQLIDAEMEDATFGMYGSGYTKGVVQKHRQWAVFAEDHIALPADLTLTLGARYDHHNEFDGNLSPRAYLAWLATPDWTFKGGVSTGYKAPSAELLFPGIMGFGDQGTLPLVGTPDLQPESSINYELAAYFDNGNGVNYNVTLFRNNFEDKIASSPALPNCYDASSTQVLFSNCVDIGPGWAEVGYTTFSQRINIDKAVAQGVEVGSRFDLTSSLMLSANYTYTDSEQKSGLYAGEPIIGVPEHMANATLSWQATQPLTLSLVAEARSSRFYRDRSGTGEYLGYELYHLGARYQVNESLTFNARVNNILDDDLSSRSCSLNSDLDGYDCTADYNTTEKARSVWLSANVNF